MKNIAIIPARSGSKGVKDKNIKILNGKPLMAYTIEAAVNSGVFDEVMVSTDSFEYAKIAEKYGASIPFMRSSKNATDTASSWDLVEEILERYKALGKTFETFCLLQPTSPLRNETDIKKAYELFNNKASFAVVSVCEAEHSPMWCGHLPEDHELVNFIDQRSMKQRQAEDKFYRLNGAIYIVSTDRFFIDRYLYQKGSYAFVMDQKSSVDIDTEIDFKLAECLMSE